MKNNSGFTLIEVVIVLAMIGALSSIAFLSVQQWLPGYRLKEAARDLYNNMQYAKSKAITENRPWEIIFYTGSSPRYEIVPDGEPPVSTVTLKNYGSGVDFGHQAGTTKYKVGGAVSDDIDYSSPDDIATFNANGTSDAGFVYLTNSNQQTCGVGTFASGIVLYKRWDGSNWH